MVSYSKLHNLLKERNISKTQLARDIKISSDTLAKLSKNVPVSLDVIARICAYLGVASNDIFEFVEENTSSPLLDRLVEEMSHSIKGGIYHETQVRLTYSSNHIEGSKLTEEQTRLIFETSTILMDKDKGINVDDVVETSNHFSCIKFIIKNVYEPLSEKFIKEIHRLLKSGTSDSRLDWFNVGEYKTRDNIVGGRETCKVSDVSFEMNRLISLYNLKTNNNLEDIVDFHYKFETIHPFQDGNGRVGRLIAFKECLKHGIVPFIIDEELKAFYYRGLNQYPNEKGYLIGTFESGQDKYKKLLDIFGLEYEK